MRGFGDIAIRDHDLLKQSAATGGQGRCKQYAHRSNNNGSGNRSEVSPVLSGRCSWEELLPRKICRKAAAAKYPVYQKSFKVEFKIDIGCLDGRTA